MPETTVFVGGLPLYTIAPMESHHVNSVLAIEEASFPIPWSRPIFEAEIRNVSRVSHPFVLMEQSGSVAGFLCLWKVVDEMHINNIAISPNHRKKGLGEALINFTEHFARERDCAIVTLEVRVSNKAALCLYQKRGFKKAGKRVRYYEDNGEDAAIMTKWLQPA